MDAPEAATSPANQPAPTTTQAMDEDADQLMATDDASPPVAATATPAARAVVAAVGRRKCINGECTSKGLAPAAKSFVPADQFVCAHYNKQHASSSSSSNNNTNNTVATDAKQTPAATTPPRPTTTTQLWVCAPCLDACVAAYGRVAACLVAGRPLAHMSDLRKRADLVEVLDSSDEDEDETGEATGGTEQPAAGDDDEKHPAPGALVATTATAATAAAQTTPLAGAVLELIDAQLADALTATFARVQLPQQCDWALQTLTARAARNDAQMRDMQAELQLLQTAADRMHRRLYNTTRPAKYQVPAISLGTDTFDDEAIADTAPATDAAAPARLVVGPDWPPAGELQRPAIVADGRQRYFAVRRQMMSGWQPCRCVEVLPPSAAASPSAATADTAGGAPAGTQYVVKFDGRPAPPPPTAADTTTGPTKVVTGFHLAYGDAPAVRLRHGVRVIALIRQEGQKRCFYPGIVAEPLELFNGWRYLIFFDDGYAQYVAADAVRVVCAATVPQVWRDVHPESAHFIQHYLEQYRCERPVVQAKRGQRMETEWQGIWLAARVHAVDASLVAMRFDADQRTEWIYRGSTRLRPVYQVEQLRQAGAAEKAGVGGSGSGTAAAAAAPKHSSGLARRNEPYVEYMVKGSTAQLRSATTTTTAKSDAGQQKPAAVSEERNKARKSTASSAARAPAAPALRQRSAAASAAAKAPAIKHLNNSTIYVDADVEEDRNGKMVYYTAKRNLPPRKYRTHDCGPQCLFAITHNLASYALLARPLLSGWERQLVRPARSAAKEYIMYRAPCGLRLRRMRELHRYLKLCAAPLHVDHFNYDICLHTLTEYVVENCIVQLPDLSEGREQMPVPCVNYYDSTRPPPCRYSERRIPNAGVPLNTDAEFLCGCDCTDDCADKTKCACAQLTYAGVRTLKPAARAQDVGYEYRRLLEHVATGIYECNSRCACSRRTCLNRVAQQPLQTKLQVFKTGNRGWGLRCLNDVPAGCFVCVYAGDLLNEQSANQAGDDYGDEYFAELDYIEVVESLKEGYERDAVGWSDAEEADDGKSVASLDETFEEEEEEDDGDEEFVAKHKQLTNMNARQTQYNTRKRNTKESTTKAVKNSGGGGGGGGDLTVTDDDEVVMVDRQPMRFEPDAARMQQSSGGGGGPSASKRRRSVRKLFGRNESVYIMDAKKTGNIGRYFNHSCAPNLFVQNVFVDTHDLRFPWVAFFAMTYIRSGTELTWNYNYDVGSVPNKVLYCECGADTCRGRLL